MWVYLYICGYVEKYYICGVKAGVCIICGCALYVGIYGTFKTKNAHPLFLSSGQSNGLPVHSPWESFHFCDCDILTGGLRKGSIYPNSHVLVQVSLMSIQCIKQFARKVCTRLVTAVLYLFSQLALESFEKARKKHVLPGWKESLEWKSIKMPFAKNGIGLGSLSAAASSALPESRSYWLEGESSGVIVRHVAFFRYFVFGRGCPRFGLSVIHQPQEFRPGHKKWWKSQSVDKVMSSAQTMCQTSRCLSLCWLFVSLRRTGQLLLGRTQRHNWRTATWWRHIAELRKKTTNTNTNQNE